jgi:hypothetical protein
MKTEYTIYRVGGETTYCEVDWPESPHYEVIRDLVEPLLGAGEPLEHVSVLWRGKRADMFVSEYGHMRLTWRDPLPINDHATVIYRANYMARNPGGDPESLSAIAGTAILFHRIVWS